MPRRLSLIVVILAIWLGFLLRLYNLDAVPLRGDEAFSAMNWAEMPISQSLSEIATIEPHPPLTYVIFHIWNLIIGGVDSPFALRMLGILSNLIGIPAMYALSKHLTKNQMVSLLAALIWAVHPFEIWHSQDFRNYALWAGLSVTTLWLGLRLIVNRRSNTLHIEPKQKNVPYRIRFTLNQRAIDWGLYILFATITAFTFYTELLTLGAFGLYVIVTQRKNKAFIIRLISIQFVIVSAVLIGFIILQGSLLSSGGYGGNVEPFYAPDYLTRFLPTLAIGDTLPIELSNLWISLIVVGLLFITFITQTYRKIALLILILIGIPLVLLGIVSTRISIFHPRYVLSTVPAVILLISAGSYGIASTLSKRFPLNQNLITLVVVSPWFIISVLTLNNYFNNPALRKAPAWDELGAFLNVNVTEDDLVIQLSTDAAFGYYYTGQAQDRGLPASPSQPKSEIIAQLESAKTEYDSLYIVSNAIPDWQNADVVETWANDNMQLVRLSNASGLGIRQYKNWEISDLQSEQAIIQFDEIVELIDYQVFDSPLPTGEVVLWLYWRPLSRTAIPYKSFVHLVGDINPDTSSPLWSQDDQFPQDGRLDSTSWELNTVYRDVYYLPIDSLQSGDYQILVGWYNSETNTRLNTNQDTGAFPLATLSYSQ